ncbi:Uncharacterised protein [Vibrio cholerae]|nr:Uncharacterised protein [Vibrio cholerae]
MLRTDPAAILMFKLAGKPGTRSSVSPLCCSWLSR